MACATSGSFLVGARVVAAHDALQLRELAHHARQQIALAQFRGAPRVIHRARWRRARRRSRARRRGASCRRASRASPGRSRRRAPARRAASGALRSCSQKKAASARRGRTTRSLPSRTLDGSRLSMLLTVMKAGSSRACASSSGKVALVVLQGRDQHLARQGEEALLEAPGERHRPLDQRGDFLEQRLADQRAPVQAGGERGDFGADALAAHREIRQHAAALAQRALVGARDS